MVPPVAADPARCATGQAQSGALVWTVRWPRVRSVAGHGPGASGTAPTRTTWASGTSATAAPIGSVTSCGTVTSRVAAGAARSAAAASLAVRTGTTSTP